MPALEWTTLDGEVTYNLGEFQPSDGPVFVDGSAYVGQWPELAAAGASLVQMTEDCVVHKKVFLPLPIDLEQSAAAAERYALPWTDKLARGLLSLYTDCQSVLTDWKRPTRMYSGLSRFGGLLKQLQVWNGRAQVAGIAELHWMSSHGKDSSLEAWLVQGNDVADAAAKEAAQQNRWGEAVETDYLAAASEHQLMARFLVAVQKGWPGLLELYPDRRKKPPPPTAEGPVKIQPKAKTVLKPEDPLAKRYPTLSPAYRLVIGGNLSLGKPHKLSFCQHSSGDFLICTACGKNGAPHLRKPCNPAGKTQYTRYALDRLDKGQHPNSHIKERLIGRPRRL